MTHNCKIKRVERGHSIPALDNGYVVDVEDEGYDMVRITMHDAQGEEFYLTAHKDMPIVLDAKEPSPVW